MKYLKFFLLWGLVSFSALSLVSCGGGGGGGNGGAAKTSGITIKGVTSAGPIKGGMVKVYAIQNGKPGVQLGTAKTNSDGSYSVNIGTYTGNVLVAVTGGTYTDEATGKIVNNNVTLRAAVPGVSGSVHVAVTPLTEIAVQLAGPTTLTKENIENANSLVSSMAGGVSIINTSPIDIMDPTTSSNATGDQINYSLMLATISQMVKNGKATDVSDAISKIKDDLSDNQLDAAGNDLASALAAFIKNPHNKSGVTTLDQTKLDTAIKYITDHAITPPDNVPDLDKAKALVADLRNTVLSIYNYQGIGVPGVVETPFKNLSNELTTQIEPELSATVDRIGWIIKSAGDVEQGSTRTFDKVPYTLTINLSSDGTNASFSVTDSDGNKIDSGTLTLNDPDKPTSGNFKATMKTKSGNLTANLDYVATLSGGLYKSMTFTGSMTAPGLSIDFSKEGRKLSANVSQVPGDTGDTDDIYPTNIYFSGRIITNTSQMDGTLNISSIVWNSTSDLPLPKAATFDGLFQELKGGSATGVKFTGKITGAWNNANTYNTEIDETASNFPKWSAYFDGSIEAPSRPTITALLKVAQSEYQKYSLDVSYHRTNTDGTVVFLSGNGSLNSATKKLTATLTNQDDMKVNISFDDTKSKDEKFTGTIATSGNTKMADFYTTEGAPMVKYIDGYFESIF